MKKADQFFARRTIWALLIAPWAAVAPVVGFSVAASPVHPADSVLVMALAIAVVTAFYGYLAVFLGLPVLYLFWKNGVASWQWYWLAGTIFGLIFAVMLEIVFPSTREFI